MPDQNDNSYCCRCKSSIGVKAKVQPFRVDDGCGKYETFCPRCAVWWRMHQPDELVFEKGEASHKDGHRRFNAHQCAVAKCQICQWTVVTWGATPGSGSLVCSNCQSSGCVRVPIDPEYLDKPAMEAIEEAQKVLDDARKAVGPIASKKSA